MGRIKIVTIEVTPEEGESLQDLYYLQEQLVTQLHEYAWGNRKRGGMDMYNYARAHCFDMARDVANEKLAKSYSYADIMETLKALEQVLALQKEKEEI